MSIEQQPQQHRPPVQIGYFSPRRSAHRPVVRDAADLFWWLAGAMMCIVLGLAMLWSYHN